MSVNLVKPKQIRTYKKITTVATKMFVKYGFQGTSMAAIAKKSNIATGSIYNYFENKEKLLNEIFMIAYKTGVDFINVDIEEGCSVKENFRILARRQIIHKLNFPIQFEFMMQFAYSPLILEDIRSGYRPKEHPMVKVFTDGRKEGIIQMLSDEELFFFLFGAFNSWFLWKYFKSGEISEEEIEHVVEMSWRAISTEKTN